MDQTSLSKSRPSFQGLEVFLVVLATAEAESATWTPNSPSHLSTAASAYPSVHLAHGPIPSTK